jgi:ketosteroid isomerase-like protein
MNEHNSKMEEILAKDEIREVIMRLARGTDRRDKELMLSCYHPDATDDHGAFRGNADEFADWVVESLKPMKTQHFLGQIRIEVEGNVAYSESYCEAHHVFDPGPEMIPPEGMQSGTMDWIMWLRYLDRFERRDNGPWLIANRLCAWDFEYMVPASHRWDLGESFKRGRTDRQDPSYR